MPFGRRVTALACECGYVRVSVVDLACLGTTHMWSELHDNPVTSVRLFSLSTQLAPPPFVSAALPDPDGGSRRAGADDGEDGGRSAGLRRHASGRESLQLLVTNALGPSVVYSDLPLTEGDPPPRRHVLADSDISDVVTCSCVCDINMDGRNELVLGTYGQVSGAAWCSWALAGMRHGVAWCVALVGDGAGGRNVAEGFVSDSFGRDFDSYGG